MAEDLAREDLVSAFNEAVDPASASVTTESVGTMALPGNTQQFFCDNWPMIKQVLQFLGDKIGGIGGIAAKGLIAAGDLLHSKTCH